jgi:plastocyanin
MKNAWIWLVVAVVVIGGGVWWWQSSQTPAAAPSTSMGLNGSPNQGNLGGANAGSVQQPGAATPKTVTVSYDGNTFSPASVTINKGDTVQFVATSGRMWVASNPHPAHTGYDGTSRSQHCASGYSGPAPFDECAAGTSYSFTFDKTGTWGYHDHMNDGATGTVIVQ